MADVDPTNLTHDQWGALAAVAHGHKILPGKEAYARALDQLIEAGLVERDAAGMPLLTETGTIARNGPRPGTKS